MPQTKKLKVVVTTVPFGEISGIPLQLIEESGLELTINPLGRKLRPEEVAGVIGQADIVIAGTEPITAQVMDQCPNLKAICRVGIGLDSVDLGAAQERSIAVSYTPEGPSPAVAELSVGLIIDLLRRISTSNMEIRRDHWFRQAGRRVSECKVGIIGCGRIGTRVINHLKGGFPGVQIYANDIQPDARLDDMVNWVDKETLYRECDVISLHVPLTPLTENLVTLREFRLFKKDAVLINTARGGIVNEADLAAALKEKMFQAAAMDVFEEEPYKGELCELENVILTSHLGSMTRDCRDRMEVEATKEAIRYSLGEKFVSPVPEEEFLLAKRLVDQT